MATRLICDNITDKSSLDPVMAGNKPSLDPMFTQIHDTIWPC